MNKRSQGFTMAELMVTVAIIGVASAIALPSYQNMVIDGRVSAQANDLMAGLLLSRSEAVKRNTRVTMCKSSDGATCATTAADWSMGWIVFVDGGVAGAVDGTDTILRVQGKLPVGSILVGDTNVSNNVSYTGNGQTNTTGTGVTQTGTFSVCGPSSKGARRKISLTQGSGWAGVSTVPAATNCTDA